METYRCGALIGARHSQDSHGDGMGWIGFGIGASICFLDFTLSRLQWPIYRMRGGSRETC